MCTCMCVRGVGIGEWGTPYTGPIVEYTGGILAKGNLFHAWSTRKGSGNWDSFII